MHLCCLSLSRHCLWGSLRPFSPPFSGMFQQRSSRNSWKSWILKFHLSILFRIHLLRAFPFSIDFGVQCLCLLRLTPPFLSVAVAHFVFSCCFTLCFGLFLSIRLLSIDYSPQLFFCLFACASVCDIVRVVRYFCWFTFKSLAKPVMALELGTIALFIITNTFRKKTICMY